MPRFDDIEVAPDIWMRRRGAVKSLAVGLSAFVAILIGCFAVIGLVVIVPDKVTVTTVLIELFFWLLVAIFSFVALRLARAGLRITAREVCLRGMVRTFEIPLSQVGGFVPGVFSSLPGIREIGVQLKREAAPDLDIWAMGRGEVRTEAELHEGLTALEPLCQALNRTLEATKRGEPVGERLPDRAA